MAVNVSVVIPTYNRAHLLGRAIESVLAQTYSEFELIIADDGSSDDTARLVQRYLEPTSPFHDRIRYFYHENQGKSATLNKALLRAKGRWIAFLDSDDFWQPEKLEWQFRAISQYPECGACVTGCQTVNESPNDPFSFPFLKGRYKETFGMVPKSARAFLETPFASMVTLVCRADLVRKIEGFDPKLKFTEDCDFMFRLALVTDFCFVNMPLAIIDRSPAPKRHSGASAIWDTVEFRLQCEQYRYEKWLKISEGLPVDMRKVLRKRLREVHSGWANYYLEGDNYEKAVQAIFTAGRYQVTPSLIAKWILTRISPGLMKAIAVRRGCDRLAF